LQVKLIGLFGILVVTALKNDENQAIEHNQQNRDQRRIGPVDFAEKGNEKHDLLYRAFWRRIKYIFFPRRVPSW
jgi:hypothetical protein